MVDPVQPIESEIRHTLTHAATNHAQWGKHSPVGASYVPGRSRSPGLRATPLQRSSTGQGHHSPREDHQDLGGVVSWRLVDHLQGESDPARRDARSEPINDLQGSEGHLGEEQGGPLPDVRVAITNGSDRGAAEPAKSEDHLSPMTPSDDPPLPSEVAEAAVAPVACSPRLTLGRLMPTIPKPEPSVVNWRGPRRRGMRCRE